MKKRLARLLSWLASQPLAAQRAHGGELCRPRRHVLFLPAGRQTWPQAAQRKFC